MGAGGEQGRPKRQPAEYAVPTMTERLLAGLRSRRPSGRMAVSSDGSAPWMTWEDRAVLRAINGAARVYRWYHGVRRRLWSVLYGHVGFDDLSPSRRHRVALEIERIATWRRDGARIGIEAVIFLTATFGAAIFAFAAPMLVAPARVWRSAVFYHLGAFSLLFFLIPGTLIALTRMARWRRRTAVSVMASIRCSACLYSLVGLPDTGSEVICPECGAASTIACLRTVRRRPTPAP
jgi:hypothetical protein